MRKIELTASPENWRLFARRAGDPKFGPLRQKVFNRDSYTCQFCGFQAKQHQAIINIDNNYRNNRIDNLVTACVFCTQCFFIESIGIGDFGGGTLLFLPELTQNELNSICHVLFCAMANGTAYKDSAVALYRSLKLRSQAVEEKLGTGFSEPNVLGTLLLENQAENSVQAKRILKDLRILPSHARFRSQIEDWAKSALNELADKTPEKA